MYKMYFYFQRSPREHRRSRLVWTTSQFQCPACWTKCFSKYQAIVNRCIEQRRKFPSDLEDPTFYL